MRTALCVLLITAQLLSTASSASASRCSPAQFIGTLIKTEATKAKLGWKKYWGEVRETRGLRFFITDRDPRLGRGLRKNWMGYIFNPIETVLNLKKQTTLPLSILIYYVSPIALDPFTWFSQKVDEKNEKNLEQLYTNAVMAKDRVLGGDYLFHLYQDKAIDPKEFSLKLMEHDFFLGKWLSDSTLTPAAITEVERLGYLNASEASAVNSIARKILLTHLQNEKKQNATSKLRPGWFNDLPAELYRAIKQDKVLSKLDPRAQELLLFTYYPVPEIDGSNPIELSSQLMNFGGSSASPVQKAACENVVDMMNSEHPLTQGDALILTRKIMKDPSALTEKEQKMKKMLGPNAGKLKLRPDFGWLEYTPYENELELWKKFFEDSAFHDVRAKFNRNELGEEEVIHQVVARLAEKKS